MHQALKGFVFVCYQLFAINLHCLISAFFILFGRNVIFYVLMRRKSLKSMLQQNSIKLRQVNNVIN